MNFDLEDVKARAAQREVGRDMTRRNGLLVSTVDLLVETVHGDNFETMVFARAESGFELGDSLDCERYATRAEAEKGHQRMLEKWRNKQS